MKKIDIYINGHLYQGNYEILKDALNKLEEFRSQNFLSEPFTASEVGINGATLGSLCKMGLLKVVGKKKVWCQINEDTMKLQEVNVYAMVMLLDYFREEINKWVARHYRLKIESLEDRIKRANEELQRIVLEMVEMGI